MVKSFAERMKSSKLVPEMGVVEGNPYALNENYSFIDADTISSTDPEEPNWRGRIRGIDSPEVTKYFTDKGPKGGTPGGRTANAALINLARKRGFTDVIRTGEFDGNNREIIELKDNLGRSFETELARAGILDLTKYSTDDAVKARKLANVFGTEGVGEDYDIARNAINDAIQRETQYEMQLKKVALDEMQLAYGGNFYAPGQVAYRDPSRTLNNKAVSPFATSIDIGLNGAIEGGFGVVDMLGEKTGWDWLKNVGENRIKAQREYLASRPEIVASYKDIDGFFGDQGFLQYVANMGAISLPYMGTTIAGMMLAPATKGLSLLAPISLYTGTIWNEQEGDNKNATLAVAGGLTQTVLDRLGVQMLFKGTGATTLLNKEFRNKAIQNIRNSRNITPEAAEKLLLQSSRKEIAKFATDAAKFAKQQLVARNVARSFTKRVGLGMAAEGSTEALQESVGYTAAHTAHGFRDWDANVYVDRMIDATIAGSSLGGAFATPGTIWDYGMWYDVSHRTGKSTGQHSSKMGALAERDRKDNNGRQFNVQEENRKIKARADNAEQRIREIKSLLNRSTTRGNNRIKLARELKILERAENVDVNTRAKAHGKKLKKRTAQELATDLWKGIPGLWRGITRHAGKEFLQDASRRFSLFVDAVDGNLQRRSSGESYEDRKHHEISKINQFFGDPTSILAAFNMTDSRKSRRKFSEMFYLAFGAAKKKAGRRAVNFDRDWAAVDRDRSVSQETKDAINYFRQYMPQFKSFASKLDKTGKKLHDMQAEHNAQLGFITNYLMRAKTFDREAIGSNQGKFESLLISEYGFTPTKARETTEAILSQDGLNNLYDTADGNFSVTAKSKFRPGSHRKRTLGLAENEKFSEFMEGDLFTNVSNHAKSAIRYKVLEEFVGSDNKKLNLQLAEMEQEFLESGMDPEEATEAINKFAFDMKNYFDAESGNYKRNLSPLMIWAQKNLLFVTALTSLPLATVSNMVEIGTGLRGLTREQIFGGPNTKGSLNELARSFVEEIKNTANRFYGTAAGKVTPHKRFTPGYRRAKQLGYMSWEVGAAHTTGVSETGAFRQRVLDMYFKIVLLQQWTNAMRAGRASIAGDYITDKIATLLEGRVDPDFVGPMQANQQFTNEQAEAKEALRNLGIDPDWMVELHLKKTTRGVGLNQEDRRQYRDFMRNAEFAFVNEAVVLPKSGIRPLIFQDPRFALFTQFQGFISTFTAFHLPKMWGDLVKRGTPAMRYNMFATAATMIMLGFVSQHLKDLLKYGQTTPYFEGSEYMRRGVAASGLLGSGERLLDFAFPMYEKRYKTTVGWAFGTVAGESASLSKALRGGGIGYDVLSGEKPPETLAKISPLTQMFMQQTPAFSDLKEPSYWDFGGRSALEAQDYR